MKAWLGGTFDPVHKGHLQLAEKLVDRLGLDKLYLMPCHIAVHKDAVSASPQQRLDMLNLALSSSLNLFVDDRELNSLEPSFTYHSMSKIRQENASESISFVMGMDSLFGFSAWRNASLFSNLTNLIILERPGGSFGISEQHYVAKKQEAIAGLVDKGFTQIFECSELKNYSSATFLMLDIGLFDISSSKVRTLVKEGRSITHLVGDKIADYIKMHHLYS